MQFSESTDLHNIVDLFIGILTNGLHETLVVDELFMQSLVDAITPCKKNKKNNKLKLNACDDRQGIDIWHTCCWNDTKAVKHVFFQLLPLGL